MIRASCRFISLGKDFNAQIDLPNKFRVINNVHYVINS